MKVKLPSKSKAEPARWFRLADVPMAVFRRFACGAACLSATAGPKLSVAALPGPVAVE